MCMHMHMHMHMCMWCDACQRVTRELELCRVPWSSRSLSLHDLLQSRETHSEEPLEAVLPRSLLPSWMQGFAFLSKLHRCSCLSSESSEKSPVAGGLKS